MHHQGLPMHKEVLLIHTKCIRGGNVTCLSQGNLRYVTSSQTLRTSDTFMLCPSTREATIRQMFRLKTGQGHGGQQAEPEAQGGFQPPPGWPESDGEGLGRGIPSMIRCHLRLWEDRGVEAGSSQEAAGMIQVRNNDTQPRSPGKEAAGHLQGPVPPS